MRWAVAVLACSLPAATSAAAPPTLPGFPLPSTAFQAAQAYPAPGAIRLLADPRLAYLDRGRFSGPSLSPAPRDQGQDLSQDLAFIQSWPAVLRLGSGKLGFDLTPHAGFGWSSGGGRTTEAGAMVRFGARVRDRLVARPDASLPEQSQMFLYAGTRRKAGGMGLLAHRMAPAGDANARDGLVKETQAGVAFGRAGVRAAFGYTREKIVMRAMGEDVRNDNRIGLTLTIR